jgi:F-type H+-transporting ATPase subunit 8
VCSVLVLNIIYIYFFSISLNFVLNMKKKIKIMPQLIPYYFLNQVIFTLILILIVLYIFSKYILPMFVFLNIIRIVYTELGIINIKMKNK